MSNQETINKIKVSLSELNDFIDIEIKDKLNDGSYLKLMTQLGNIFTNVNLLSTDVNEDDSDYEYESDDGAYGDYINPVSGEIMPQFVGRAINETETDESDEEFLEPSYEEQERENRMMQQIQLTALQRNWEASVNTFIERNKNGRITQDFRTSKFNLLNEINNFDDYIKCNCSSGINFVAASLDNYNIEYKYGECDILTCKFIQYHLLHYPSLIFYVLRDKYSFDELLEEYLKYFDYNLKPCENEIISNEEAKIGKLEKSYFSVYNILINYYSYDEIDNIRYTLICLECIKIIYMYINSFDNITNDSDKRIGKSILQNSITVIETFYDDKFVVDFLKRINININELNETQEYFSSICERI